MLKKHRYVTVITAIALLLLNACDDGRCCNAPLTGMPTEIAWKDTVYRQKQLNFETFSEFFAESGIPETPDYYLIWKEDLTEINQQFPKGRYLVWEFLGQEGDLKVLPNNYEDENHIFHVYTNDSLSWFIVSPIQLKGPIEEYESEYLWKEHDSMLAYLPNETVYENRSPIKITMEMNLLDVYSW